MSDNAPHPASIDVDQLRAGCTIRFQRRSGPGGQHRNKVETSVHLVHNETGVTASASERRAQTENLKVAIHRLRVQLALEVRRPWEGASTRWQQRLRGTRLTVNDQNQDFPALLAEALDALEVVGWDHRLAAERLGTTATQLLKFLQREPRAFERLNKQRVATGKKTLKFN